MVVIEVSPFLWKEQLDKDFLIIPGRSGDIRVTFCIAVKFSVELLIGILWLLVIVDEEINDLVGFFLHVLNVKGDFCANHMLGVEISVRGVNIGIVLGTAMA